MGGESKEIKKTDNGGTKDEIKEIIKEVKENPVNPIQDSETTKPESTPVHIEDGEEKKKKSSSSSEPSTEEEIPEKKGLVTDQVDMDVIDVIEENQTDSNKQSQNHTFDLYPGKYKYKKEEESLPVTSEQKTIMQRIGKAREGNVYNAVVYYRGLQGGVNQSKMANGMRLAKKGAQGALHYSDQVIDSVNDMNVIVGGASSLGLAIMQSQGSQNKALKTGLSVTNLISSAYSIFASIKDLGKKTVDIFKTKEGEAIDYVMKLMGMASDILVITTKASTIASTLQTIAGKNSKIAGTVKSIAAMLSSIVAVGSTALGLIKMGDGVKKFKAGAKSKEGDVKNIIKNMGGLSEEEKAKVDSWDEKKVKNAAKNLLNGKTADGKGVLTRKIEGPPQALLSIYLRFHQRKKNLHINMVTTGLALLTNVIAIGASSLGLAAGRKSDSPDVAKMAGIGGIASSAALTGLGLSKFLGSRIAAKVSRNKDNKVTNEGVGNMLLGKIAAYAADNKFGLRGLYEESYEIGSIDEAGDHRRDNFDTFMSESDAVVKAYEGDEKLFASMGVNYKKLFTAKDVEDFKEILGDCI